MSNHKKYKSILVISDQHFPYNHPDIIAFLRAIKKKYKPDKIVNIGDEVDWHACSFHEHNSDLPSAGDELKTAINRMQPLFKLFPDMDLLESNHGSMIYRKAIASGLPRHVFRDYREILQAPRGWHWHHDLVLYASNGQPIYFCHGKSNNVLKNSQEMGMSFVSGHYHNNFDIRYWGNKLGLYWGMIVGCLIDDNSLAYNYNKVIIKRPVIGCGMIIDGHPKLIPMVLDKNARWIKKLV